MWFMQLWTSVGFVWLLFSANSFAEDSNSKLGLKDIQQIARQHNKGLQAIQLKVEAVHQHIESQAYNWRPEAGMLFGGSAAGARGNSDASAIGYGYLRYTLFDGGLRSLESDLREIEKSNLQNREDIVSKDLDSHIAHHFYRYAIFSKGAAEIEGAKKSMRSLDDLANKLSNLGSLPRISLTGIQLAKHQIAIIEKEIRQEAHDAGLELRRFIDVDVLSRINIDVGDIPKTREIDTRAKTTDIQEADLRYRKSNARSELYKNTWLPEVAVEARYGQISIMDRDYEEPVQGEVLLTADWNFTSILQKRSERHALLKERSALQMELEYQRSLLASRGELLKEKLQKRIDKVSQIASFTDKLEEYFKSLKSEVNRGTVPLAEAKSALLEYVEQLKRLTEEQASMWAVYVEMSRLGSVRKGDSEQ